MSYILQVLLFPPSPSFGTVSAIRSSSDHFALMVWLWCEGRRGLSSPPSSSSFSTWSSALRRGSGEHQWSGKI